MKRNITRILLTGFAVLSCITMSANPVVDEKSSIMAERDPYGIIMTITAAGVVFAALIVLSVIYTYVGKFFTKNMNKNTKIAAATGKSVAMTDETALAIAMALNEETGAEVQAAIGLALHQHMNDCVHDNESFVLTIRPTFSAWASRSFTLRQQPAKK